MAEWLKTALIDIVELIGGGTPKTSKAEYWGGNINWLSVKDFNNENRYVYSTEKTITEEGLNNSSTKLLKKDDIIISARGTVGELAMIPFPMAFNQSCYGIRAKEGIDSIFLYYLIKNSVRKLKAITHGSVFDTITRDTFANIEVAIPDIKTQHRIAKMLADIDDKVENNQRINNNLSKLFNNQDHYLLECRKKYPKRIKVCCLYEEKEIKDEWIGQFDGIKICAGRLKDQNLLHHKEIFEKAERLKKFISIDMADGDAQTDAMEQLIETYPDLRIAIGHFGMVTTDGWEKQIALAKHEHVYIESGGITWLFHKEFYPYPSAVRAIRTAIDICGIDKLMWGSDYPRTMTAITYDMSKDFIEKTTELSEEEKIKFLGENARAFYGFEELEVPEKIRNMVE